MAEPYKFAISKLLEFFDTDFEKYKPYSENTSIALPSSVTLKIHRVDYFNKDGNLMFYIMTNDWDAVSCLMTGSRFKNVKGKIRKELRKIESSKNSTLLIDSLCKYILSRDNIKIDKVTNMAFTFGVHYDNYADYKKMKILDFAECGWRIT